jgi:cyclopropane fatty-acyl-phospholipid synthase-like methyltransferase
MTGASPKGAWQREEVASVFRRERRTVIPLLDLQEDLVRRLLEASPHQVTRFLDVGAGDGAMSELVLSIYPDAEAVLVDFSEPMLEGVERRLAGGGARWQIVRGDLSQAGWREALPAGNYGAAVSALAIHHLSSARKRALFAELFQLLEPGAMFVNMDYTLIEGPLRGLWDAQLLANAVHAEHQRRGSRSEAEVERDLFDDSEDDRPDSVEEQLQWLRDAGFERVELHFKWAEAAIFSGVKPDGDES